jgi:hypothetical protein
LQKKKITREKLTDLLLLLHISLRNRVPDGRKRGLSFAIAIICSTALCLKCRSGVYNLYMHILI